MLILKSLTFENIGRFVEPQTIDFTTLGSLVQVDGQNNNTGGSSGAGKSTIFKALEFLLGLNDISNGVLQSRLTKSPMSITGIFELDGQPLKIERNKKLLIELNGEVTTGSSKLSEEKLDEIIGMPRDLFRKILHKRQGEGGFFLDMGPSDVHKFLISCLSLDKEQAKVLTLDTRLKTLIESETSLKSAIQSNQMGLEASQGAILSLGSAPVLEIAPEAIEELKNKHLEASNNHKLVKDSNKKELDDLEALRPKIETVPFDRTDIERVEVEIGTIFAQISELEKVELNRQSTIKTKISDLQMEIGKLNNAEQARQSDTKSLISKIQAEIIQLQAKEKNRQTEVQNKISSNNIEKIKASALFNEGNRAKEEASKLIEELNKVRLSICPTCEQGWVNDAAKARESTILIKLQECKRLVISGIEAEKKLLSLHDDDNRLRIDLQPKPIPEIKELEDRLSGLQLELQPKSIPEVESYQLLIGRYRLESGPQAIPEAIELKLKNDFKNKELLSYRHNERDHQTKENDKNRVVLAQFAQKQEDLRKSHETTLNFVRDEENKALAEYTVANNKVKIFEDNKKRFEESLKKLEDQEFQYKDKSGQANIKLSLALEEIELATEAKGAIKSYISCSFEDALDSIGDTATRFIRSIPNMANATVQLDGVKITKDGNLKEEVIAIISMDGEIGIPIKSLSGGERSSTNLAVDLSVIKFIEERTGQGCNVYFMDEIFTGMDSKNILEALEMLKECSFNKQLFVVDHNPEIAQFMENRIVVIREESTSNIQRP